MAPGDVRSAIQIGHHRPESKLSWGGSELPPSSKNEKWQHQQKKRKCSSKTVFSFEPTVELYVS
jgi:hypothetical protein